jgi:Kef-type K+ transport system membrane component KefB
MWSSFAYHEPSSTQIVILLSFLLFLNLAGAFAQRFLSAGLLGQILVGIIYGTPLAGILEQSWEEAIVAVGYVGLLLVVFEGPSRIPLNKFTY